ncbi:MFS transporter [Orrella sp. JC864]|uniref:MFS transporter n=1 Tax=Orrella sp. JC864 TaxID=3120298 RepID=UPI003008C570
MQHAAPADPGISRRVVVAEIVGAFLVILVLAQALTGVLGLAAFSRLAANNTAERVELIARDTAARIETGLRLGKPMAQFSGLDRLIEQSLARVPDLAGAAVALPDGYAVGRYGQAGALPEPLRAAVLAPGAPGAQGGIERRPGGAALMHGEQALTLAVPLHGGDGAVAGVLAISVDDSLQAAREREFIERSVLVLGLTTLGAAALLLAVLGWLMPLQALTRPGGRARLAVPLAALILAQGVYAADTVTAFRSAWLQSTRANVAMLAESVQADIGRVLRMGIGIDRLRGIETLFARVAGSLPSVADISLRDAQGRVLYAADGRGALDPARIDTRAGDGNLLVSLPLSAGRGQDAPADGYLAVQLDPAVVAAGVRSRVMDAGTVALISAIAAFEMFLLLTLLIARSRRGTQQPHPEGIARRAEDAARAARPVMFGFLFAWALPLSFLPLFARTLPSGMLALPQDILLALPLSAEMLCGLVGALAAGRITDRHGWHWPVIGGLLLAAAGSLASAATGALETFVLARGTVGLGYGLAWMGLQGFVVLRSSPLYRGRNMAWLVAGLFAGHLSGTAVGAMLADQAGYRPVFAASAVVLLLPLAGVGLLTRRWRGKPPEPATAIAARPPASATARLTFWASARRLGGLLASRDFGALLAGAVVPFSIAQVGLLYFALPLYLEAQGVPAANIGRVLMVYGLCMIYLGPAIGRLVDCGGNKKYFIALGGLLGGGGMAYLYVDSSLQMVALAVFLLALGSCWAGAAQTSWTLSLPRVQQYGPGAATSVMRAADKLGQMIGPLFVGALFTLVGVGAGLAVTGMVYLAATLLFVAVAPNRIKGAA